MTTEMVDGEPPDKERTVRRVCLRLCGGDVTRARTLAMAYMRARRKASMPASPGLWWSSTPTGGVKNNRDFRYTFCTRPRGCCGAPS